jgi:hypothetical protein
MFLKSPVVVPNVFLVVVYFPENDQNDHHCFNQIITYSPSQKTSHGCNLEILESIPGCMCVP